MKVRFQVSDYVLFRDERFQILRDTGGGDFIISNQTRGKIVVNHSKLVRVEQDLVEVSNEDPVVEAVGIAMDSTVVEGDLKSLSMTELRDIAGPLGVKGNSKKALIDGIEAVQD